MTEQLPPAAIVVAHPDDECLWLSSALASSNRTVFCFGDLFQRPRKSEKRRRAVAALPLAGLTDLRIPESGSGFLVDWARPQPTDYGIAITDPRARARYEDNYFRVLNALRPTLADRGAVYTHNPWGEYGHAEHIQVYRAIAALQAELGYTIWFSNYVGPASWPLAQLLGRMPCWSDRRTVPPDMTAARGLMRIYRRCGAWTWTGWHRWPAEETLYAQYPAGDPAARQTLVGHSLLDVTGLRYWSLPWRSERRRLD